MKTYKLKKGYDVPIDGQAEKKLEDNPKTTAVALCPAEFRGLKPRLDVQPNDSVKIGTPLFHDKKQPKIQFCSPMAGKITEIKYGPRRIIEQIIITPSGSAFEQHKNYRKNEITSIKRDQLVEHLLKGGLWPFIRQRPFNTIANPEDTPHSIFINCMDTAPLSNDPEFSLQGKFAEFEAGTEALKILSGGKVHLVVGNPNSEFLKTQDVEKHTFSGRHPAGLVGTHIGRIDPIIGHKLIWYLNARDLIQLGSFLLVGQYPTERIVAIAGPGTNKRCYIKTTQGARISDLIGSHLAPGEQRFISGNILTGRKIEADGFLGFYDDLFTVLAEGRDRQFLGWLAPGFDRPSFTRAFISAALSKKKFPLHTNNRGEERPMVKTGDYERVMGLDVLPDFLMKAILADDIDLMEQLGIMECDPEDFALCSYICPSKIEFTEVIQKGMEMMEAETAS